MKLIRRVILYAFMRRYEYHDGKYQAKQQRTINTRIAHLRNYRIHLSSLNVNVFDRDRSKGAAHAMWTFIISIWLEQYNQIQFWCELYRFRHQVIILFRTGTPYCTDSNCVQLLIYLNNYQSPCTRMNMSCMRLSVPIRKCSSKLSTELRMVSRENVAIHNRASLHVKIWKVYEYGQIT